MIDTVFQHRRSRDNVGDLACTPAHYFDLGSHEIIDFGQDAPACERLVLGGGQVFNSCVNAVIYHGSAARARIVWGVGISEKDSASVEFDILEGSCALIGSRNWGVPKCEYVPCATAMSPLFDAVTEPVHDAVLFWHLRKSEHLRRVPGMPEMSNHGVSMAQAIDFLASGATVVTNSYHGAYWGMCLGRRVLAIPFSNKFRQFRENPIFAKARDWPDYLGRAERREGLLEEARTQNLAFYEKVMNLA